MMRTIGSSCWHLDAASTLQGLIEQLARPISGNDTAMSEVGPHRLTVCGPDRQALEALRAQARQQLQAQGKLDAHEDTFYTDNPLGPQGVALMFPGQGSQHPGMLADWLQVPAFSESLVELDEVARPLHGRSLKTWFFGDANHPENSLSGTLAAQTSLGYACAALARTLDRMGVNAAWAVGHSYGELVALWHAGAYDDATLMRLTLERGQAMAEAAQRLPGGLVAVGANGDAVSTALKDWPDLEIANLNAPTQTVVGGPRSTLESFAKSCQQLGWRCAVIQGAAAAFHTSRMQPALSAWHEHLQHCAGQNVLHATTRARVIANCSVTAYPSEEASAAAFIAQSLQRQVISQVRWVETCQALYAAGVRLFIEVGPGQVLSKLVKQNLGEQPHRVISCAPKGDAAIWPRLARLQAELAVHGALLLPLDRLTPPPDALPNAPVMKPDTPLIEAFLQENTRIVQRYFALMERVLDTPSTQAVTDVVLQQMLGDCTRLTHAHLQVHERLLGAAGGSSEVPTVEQLTPSLPAPDSVTSARPVVAVEQNNAHDLMDWLKQEVSQLTGFPISGIAPDARFEDLGVDSLAFMDIYTRLTQRMAISEAAAERILSAKCLADVTAALGTSQGSPTANSATESKLSEWLRARVAEATGFAAADIDVHAALEDLGIDSLARTDLFEALGQAWPQARQHASALFEARSIDDIVTLMSKATQVAAPATVVSPASPKVVNSPAPLRELPPVLQDLKAQLLTSLAPNARQAGVPLDEATPFQALSLNSFDRARLWGQAALWQAPLKIAGEALISVSSVKEGLELLANLPQIDSVKRKDPAGRPADRLQRYRHTDVPRHLPEPTALQRVWLIGPASDRTDQLATSLRESGTSVQRLTLTERGWLLPGSAPIEFDDIDGLRQGLREASADPRPCAAVFITPQAQPGLDTGESLEAPALALFSLAKAIGGTPSAGLAINRLVVLLAGDPLADAGARGVARALSHEWRQQGISVSSVSVDGASDLRLGLSLACAHPGKHDLWLEGGKAGERIADPHPEIDPPANSTLDLGEDSVVLLFGGGVGIAAEVGIDLARRYRCRVVAVGRTPWSEENPHPEVPDDDALSEAVFAELKRTSGADGPDSQRLQAALGLARRQRALAETARRVREAGGQFHYLSADLTQADAVSQVIDQVATSLGRIDMVIHAAGVVEDRGLQHKSVESFRRVFRTKAHSAWHLRSALGQHAPKYVVFFSSLVSHTGNAGQSDYCAGNEVLNAMASEMAAACPDSRVASMLWSVWTETGLANKAVQQRMAQMGMTGIANADGTRRFHNELSLPTVPDWLLISCPRMLEVMQGSAAASAATSAA